MKWEWYDIMFRYVVQNYSEECLQTRSNLKINFVLQGKTLQTLVTMLDNRPILQHTKPGVKHPPSAPDLEARQREEALWANALKEWNHELDMVQVPKKTRPKTMRGARAGTLVVCPVIALSQWKTEIEKFTAPNTLTVGTYHGPSRNKEMPKELLQKYDVVLTTYQVLEQDFRKMVAPNKVTCPNCGGKYKMDKLRVHLKYFCGEGAQRTEAQRRQRRAGERRGPGNGGGPPGGGGRGGKGKKRGKKPPMSKTAAKKQKTSPTQTASRKTIHVRASAQYDSDSELSVEEDFSLRTTSRPSRSAAVKASKKVRTSMKSWGANQKKASRSDDDESSFAWENSDDSDSSGDESDIPFKNFAKKPASVDEEKEGCDEDDDSSVDRAIARQQKAMNAAKKSSRKTPKKKATPRKPAGKKTAAKKTAAKKYSKKKTKATKKGKGKMISKSPDSSGGSSDSDSDDSDSVDPLAGIDLDELAEEALAGSRFSLLHSFCWWRVVLDEAHMIKSRSSQTAA